MDEYLFADTIDERIKSLNDHIQRCDYVLKQAARDKTPHLTDAEYDGICRQIENLEQQLYELEDKRDAWLLSRGDFQC